MCTMAELAFDMDWGCQKCPGCGVTQWWKTCLMDTTENMTK